MKRRVSTFLAALAISGHAHAQAPLDEAMTFYQRMTQRVIGNAYEMFVPVMEEEEQWIASAVSTQVTRSTGLGGFAHHRGGDRQITIHAGMSQMFEWIFQAIWMESQYGLSGCFVDFAGYYFDGLGTNTAGIIDNLPGDILYSPELFGELYSNACSGLGTSVSQDPVYAQARAGIMDASIAFLFLHEMGHHVLGHTDSPDSSLAESRREEDDADRFAIRTALKANFNLIGSFPFFIFDAVLSGNSLTDELQSTHPLGIKRLYALLEETYGFYSSNPDRWPDPGTYGAMLDDLDRQLDQVDSILAGLE